MHVFRLLIIYAYSKDVYVGLACVWLSMYVEFRTVITLYSDLRAHGVCYRPLWGGGGGTNKNAIHWKENLCLR